MIWIGVCTKSNSSKIRMKKFLKKWFSFFLKYETNESFHFWLPRDEILIRELNWKWWCSGTLNCCLNDMKSISSGWTRKKNGGCALKWAEKEGNKTTEETPRRQRRVVERRRRTRRFVRRVVFNWLVLFPARPSTLAKKAHRSVPELPDRLGGGCSSVRFFLCALLQRRMFLKSRKSCHHFHYSFFFNLSHANGWFHRTFNQIHHSKWVIPLSQGW